MFSPDLKSKTPIYEQLYNNVIKLTALGVIKPNEQLPTVRSLARQLGVNPNTVQKAYQMLEHDGIIYSILGKGSFVCLENDAINQKKSIAMANIKTAINEALDIGITNKDIKEFINGILNIRGDLDD